MAAPSGGGGGGGPIGFSGGVASTGQGLNFIQVPSMPFDLCYATSGEVVTLTSVVDTTALSFNSGQAVIEGRFYFGVHETTDDNLEFRVEYNEEIIYATEYSLATNAQKHTPNFVDVVIPPDTTVTVIVLDRSTGTIDTTTTFSGRVYA
jgi:hypothetical protein